MEATPRFELGNKGFADLCLTTWLCRHKCSGCKMHPVKFLARVAGFEPADDGIRIRCLTTWRYPIIRFYMGWVVGFEPTHTGATTLGLNHLTIPTILSV